MRVSFDRYTKADPQNPEHQYTIKVFDDLVAKSDLDKPDLYIDYYGGAAAVGKLNGQAYVIISPYVKKEAIPMALGHELGHIKNGDLDKDIDFKNPDYSAVLPVSIGIAAASLYVLNTKRLGSAFKKITNSIEPPMKIAGAVLLGITSAVFTSGYAKEKPFMERRAIERKADEFAAEIAPPESGVAFFEECGKFNREDSEFLGLGGKYPSDEERLEFFQDKVKEQRAIEFNRER